MTLVFPGTMYWRCDSCLTYGEWYMGRNDLVFYETREQRHKLDQELKEKPLKKVKRVMVLGADIL